MDEYMLNDLLECSVCLERLDTTSKVLPCQHTFCKKCLEEILHTHKRLRCPECRVLVEVDVGALPPNVLLMRILESIKNAPKKNVSDVNQPQTVECRPENNANVLGSTTGDNYRLRVHKQQSKAFDIRQPHALAMYNFNATEPGDLSFRKGDIILLHRKIDNNWYRGECNGLSGVFPLPYVKVVVPLPSDLSSYIPSQVPQIAQCVALYGFNKYHEDDEGCLHFKKGDVITVIKRIDENWAEGKFEDRIGIFPITFVEMNHLAKILMSHSTTNHVSSRDAPPTPTDEAVPLISDQIHNTENAIYPLSLTSTSSDTLMSPLSPSSSSSAQSATTTSPSSSSDSTTPPSPSLSPIEHGAAIKRHSYTMGAMPPPYQAPPAVHRHSVEIINSDDVVTQDPTNTRNVDDQSQQLQTEVQQPQQLPSGKLTIEERMNIQRQFKNNPLELMRRFQVNGEENFTRQGSYRSQRHPNYKLFNPPLPARYVALYSYKPQKADELELKKDIIYTVIERCQDGWFKGTTPRGQGQKCGVFPGNYVIPLRSLTALQAQQRALSLARQAPEINCSTKPVNASTGILKTGHFVSNTSGRLNDGLTPPDLPPRSLSPVFTSSSYNHPYISNLLCPLSLLESTTQRTPQAAPAAAISAVTATIAATPTTVESPAVKVKSTGPAVKSASPAVKSTSPAVKSTMELEADKVHKAIISSLIQYNNSPIGKAQFKPVERTKGRKDNFGLIKRLTSMKKSRSPPPAPFLVDNPIFDISSSQIPRSHARSDSCPSKLSYNTTPLDSSLVSVTSITSSVTSESTSHHRLLYSSPSNSQRIKQKHYPAIQIDHSPQSDLTSNGRCLARNVRPAGKDDRPAVNHQKSSSLDTAAASAPFNDDLTLLKYKNAQAARERYRVIASYPPNSESELELMAGDIIMVHKKRDDGWYKGTLQRNGRTGLFPASFVELIKE